jgi:hypothetical protein
MKKLAARPTAASRSQFTALEQLPNVGPAVAAVLFLSGKPARPWWAYTAGRKRALQARGKEPQTA